MDTLDVHTLFETPTVELVLGRVLGRAVAHEVGHFLLFPAF